MSVEPTGDGTNANTNNSDTSSNVATVKVSIRDGSGNYYDGTAFNSASQVFLTATGTSSWSYSIASSKLTDGHTYNISVQTTDDATNANTNNSAASASFVYDTTSATHSINSPTNNSHYNSAGWPGSISGSASDTSSNVATVKVSIRDEIGKASCR